MKVCPSLIGENSNESLCIRLGYSLMTEMLNNEYKDPSFLGDGKEDMRNPMTIEFQNWRLELLDCDCQESTVSYPDKVPW